MLSPDDEALLNDLLDERLGAAEEAALSARLEREPSLREAWDELVRAREFVRDAPDPVPPADFTARVRARLAAAEPAGIDAAQNGAPSPVELPPLRAVAAPAARPAEVPLLWRRMMTVAYAAAAALILGIGLFALKDRERSAAPGETNMARAPEAARDARTESSLANEKGDSAQPPAGRLEGGVVPPREADKLERNAADPTFQGWLGEPKAEAKEAEGAADTGAPRPHFGAPGGSVPPNLRAPSDSPARRAEPSSTPDAPPAPVTLPPPPEPAPASARPPAAPAPAPRGPVDAPRTAERSDDGEKRPGEDRSGLARLGAAHVSDAALGELLVLEATSIEAGRALLTSVVAGPGARSRGAAPEGLPAAAAKSVVPLRRLDPTRDGSLIAAVKAQDAAARLRAPAPAAPAPPPSTPPTSPAPFGVPLPGAPTPTPAPTTAPAPAPTPAPAGAPPTPSASGPAVGAPSAGYGAPSAGGSGGSAPAVPSLLGVETRTFTADEYARIVALLGPLDGAAGASEDAKKKDKGIANRRVRVLIVRPLR